MWEEVPHDVGKTRERELTSISPKPALDKGAQMVCHHNTEKSAHDIIRRIMNNRTLVLQIQRELVDERKDITNTAAGESVNVELTEETKRREAALNLVWEEMSRGAQHRFANEAEIMSGSRDVVMCETDSGSMFVIVFLVRRFSTLGLSKVLHNHPPNAECINYCPT
jgi:hypothetical protein